MGDTPDTGGRGDSHPTGRVERPLQKASKTMSTPTRLTVIGTVGTQPVSHTFESGDTRCSFRLAVSHRYRDSSGAWVDSPTSWYTVNAFRALGRNAQDSFAVGDRVIVSGKLRVKDWVNETKSGTEVEIDAEALGPELRFGVSTFQKRDFASGEKTSQEMPLAS